MSEQLWSIVRDAMRYRELRKHVNRGCPHPGLPFVNGWSETNQPYYIREGELDDAMDEVFNLTDRWDDVDKIMDSVNQREAS